MVGVNPVDMPCPLLRAPAFVVKSLIDRHVTGTVACPKRFGGKAAFWFSLAIFSDTPGMRPASKIFIRFEDHGGAGKIAGFQGGATTQENSAKQNE